MTVRTFPVSASTLGLAPTASAWAIQKVLLSGTPTGGTFTLTYSGQTTAAIPYNATAYQVEQALRVLTNIGVGNVIVGGGVGPTNGWFVNFVGALDFQAITLMTIDTTGLTGGTPSGAVTTVQPGHTTPSTTNPVGIPSLTYNNGSPAGTYGWHQLKITTPPTNTWTGLNFTVFGVHNGAPVSGQLWPRSNVTLNWTY